MTGGRLTEAELRAAVADSTIDTVLLLFVDMQGRPQGKRCAGRYFVEEVLAHGSAACDYLLGVDVEMVPLERLGGWDSGYGDLRLIPDVTSIRRIAWRDRTAVCFADAFDLDGAPIAASPREMLRRQVKRLQDRGWTPLVATELEFIAHRDSYQEAWDADYRHLTPITRYNVDYSLLGTADAEPFMSAVVGALSGSGFEVETVKGEAHRGQFEIGLRYGAPLDIADGHVLFKLAVKEIAQAHDVSATFMAKWDEREGSSCHVHFSLRDESGHAVFGADADTLKRFVAGQLAHMAELSLAFAPNVNSYKRYAAESFAPNTIAWGEDNRTCAIRVVGHGASRRFEHRAPGADANPYLALAAVIAAGLAGMDADAVPPAPEKGNAYASSVHPRLPADLRTAADLFDSSRVARQAFGDETVDHYAAAARAEADAFRLAVTDWERRRGYERL